MNPNDPAFPMGYPSAPEYRRTEGLTKREYFSIRFATTMYHVAEDFRVRNFNEVTDIAKLDENICHNAVFMADKLIVQLSKTEAKE